MRIDPAYIGYWYGIGFMFCFLGLLGGAVPFMIIGPLILIFTFWNDDDPANHVDPADTIYMDRDGQPVGREE